MLELNACAYLDISTSSVPSIFIFIRFGNILPFRISFRVLLSEKTERKSVWKRGGLFHSFGHLVSIFSGELH